MGASRTPGPVKAQGRVLPACTPGPFGRNDAADPDAPMCVAGDSPGPLGFGADLACVDPPEPVASFPVTLVDEGRVIGQIRRAAFLRASLEEAARGMDAHIAAGTRDVELRAAQLRGELLSRWARARQAGGDAVLEFCRDLAQANADDFDALMDRYAGHVARGQRRVKAIGYAGMVVSTVGFAATVARKVVAERLGPVGWGIDVTTEVAIAGIDALYGVTEPGEAAKSPSEAELDKLLDEVRDEMLQHTGEHVLDSTIAKLERIYQLAERMGTESARFARIEGELGGALARLEMLENEGRRRRGALRRAGNSARRLKALLESQRAVLAPVRRAAAVVGAAGARPLKAARWVADHGGGKLVGAVFVAKDVTQAYQRWRRELAAFSD